MIYSPAVYMITGWRDQSGSNGQLNLHFIQRISAPPASLWLSWELWSRRDEAACVPLWSRTHLTGSLTVFIVPRENGKSMELTCPIQCTYHLTEVTGRKRSGSAEQTENFERSPGTFFQRKLRRVDIASQMRPFAFRQSLILQQSAHK